VFIIKTTLDARSMLSYYDNTQSNLCFVVPTSPTLKAARDHKIFMNLKHPPSLVPSVISHLGTFGNHPPLVRIELARATCRVFL
jgi:hypothetical protein